MSQIYNIALGEDFLKTAAEIVHKEASRHIIVLPNRRSCREFKKHLTSYANNSFLPQIMPLSSCIGADEFDITFKIIDILRARYSKLALNILYDLADSVSQLIKKFILNNSDCSILHNSVPTEYSKYWEVTETVFRETLRNPQIQSIIKIATKKADIFAQCANEIALIGVNGSFESAKCLTEHVLKSEKGIVITCGLENGGINAKLAREALGDKYKVQNVSRETFSSNVKQAVFISKSEEALAIAAVVREAIERQKSVIVVSSDKDLTRQIQAQLLRWNIVADSSIGQTFSQTQTGILFSLVLDMIEQKFETSSVINALKMSEFVSDVINLEMMFRKNQSVSPNFFEAVKSLKSEEKPSDTLHDFINKIEEISVIDGERSFAEWLEFCLRYVALINVNAVEKIKEIARPFYKHSANLPLTDFAEFTVFFKSRITTQNYTTATGFTPNVTILGAIEAQLSHADMVIIAEANEAEWTSQNHQDFWITKSMQKRLNIPSVDVDNEFLQCVFERLIHKPEVLITRADIVDGVKQQPYRFYEKTADTMHIENADDVQNLLDNFKKSCPRQHLKFQPPSPPLNVRPTKMYVTEIEALFNNPYAFYAKKILKLKECSHINENENIRGKYIHEVLNDFVKNSSNKTDIERLNKSAEKILQNKWLTPVHFGIWYFRIRKIFAFVTANMNNHAKTYSEKTGDCFVDITPDYSVKIAARADRIDVSDNQQVSIIDYKTGVIPSKNEAKSGEKPQLSLEAAIALRDGFKINATNVSKISFWKLDGKDEGGTITDIATTQEEAKATAEEALKKLSEAVVRYNLNGEAYNINLRAQYDNAYKHLARVKEWYNAE